MSALPVEVAARWSPEGWPAPSQITWEGRTLPVQDVGRRWKTGDGVFLLARVADGRVFELHTNGARWWGRVVSPPTRLA